MSVLPIDNGYDLVIPILLANPGFKGSAEFAGLLGVAEDLPGVVAAAYAQYVEAMLSRGQSGELSGEVRGELIGPLNALAALNDSKVNTMLRDEVFEQMQVDGSFGIIAPLMNSDLRQLFYEWSADET